MNGEVTDIIESRNADRLSTDTLKVNTLESDIRNLKRVIDDLQNEQNI